MMGVYSCCLTESERESDRQAHRARVAMLGVDLGRRGTRMVLRVLQFFGIFDRA